MLDCTKEAVIKKELKLKKTREMSLCSEMLTEHVILQREKKAEFPFNV